MQRRMPEKAGSKDIGTKLGRDSSLGRKREVASQSVGASGCRGTSGLIVNRERGGVSPCPRGSPSELTALATRTGGPRCRSCCRGAG